MRRPRFTASFLNQNRLNLTWDTAASANHWLMKAAALITSVGGALHLRHDLFRCRRCKLKFSVGYTGVSSLIRPYASSLLNPLASGCISGLETHNLFVISGSQAGGSRSEKTGRLKLDEKDVRLLNDC